MRSYELGVPELDARIHELAADAVARHGHDHDDADLVAEMIVTALKLHRDDADRGDLKLVNAALKEMRYSFVVFSKYRSLRKVTVFGSARTPPEDPNYRLAADFANHMADEKGWMVVTGAGPGIMEAANRGAGPDASFGVNIRLPFEDAANPYVDDRRLINFKYFFTRKLMFVKESDAFALFPGGFGTQDETFELLTLVQTGKSSIHPIVLVEAPGGDYWDGWLEFVEGTLVEKGMISPDDLALFSRAADVATAGEQIDEFFDNYHSHRYVGDKLVLRLAREPSPPDLEQLNDDFSDIVVRGRIEAAKPSPAEIADEDHIDLARVTLEFDRRQHGRLRRLIDALNAIEAGEGTRAGD